MDDKDKITNYSQFLKGEQKDKFQSRLEELIKTANIFIDEAGYSEYVRCDERIMMNALLDYTADVHRLKDFHDIELIRTEKIAAYTVSWIIRRKPLQFFKYPEKEKDIFVNERFAAYLIINECLSDDERKYIPEQYQKKFIEYTDLLLYYLKYRECNPQVLELAIESFKMGMIVE